MGKLVLRNGALSYGDILFDDNLSNSGVYFKSLTGEVAYIRKSGTSGQLELGSDNAIYFKETDANTNVITFTTNDGAGVFTGNLTANSFIKQGGTSSQFLKADGSVDTNSYSVSTHNHDGDYIHEFGTSAITDFDTVPVTSGKYRWNTTSLSNPAPGQGNQYGTLLNLNYDNVQSTQIAHDFYQDNLYFRELNNNTDTGTTWHKLWHDGNLTPNDYVKRDGTLPMTGKLQLDYLDPAILLKNTSTGARGGLLHFMDSGWQSGIYGDSGWVHILTGGADPTTDKAVSISTNFDATFYGDIIKSGGTSNEILMADGSVDDINDYSKWSSESSATVGPGWITIANFVNTRGHGEFYIYDHESADHAFIHIEATRSYNSSSVTVLNVSGHGMRIQGARFLRLDADNTYGTRKLQVYVTVSSLYRVKYINTEKINGFTNVTPITPILEDTPTGYSVDSTVDGFGVASGGGMGSAGWIRAGAGMTIANQNVATESWVTSQGYITEPEDNQTLSWNGATGEITISNGNTIDIDGRYLGINDKAANSDLIDGVDISRIVYGGNQSGSNGASTIKTTWDASHITQYKSGFWDVEGSTWMPDTGWFWGLTIGHASNSSTYNYSGQIAFRNTTNASSVYVRNIGSNGTAGTWSKLWHDNNLAFGTGNSDMARGDHAHAILTPGNGILGSTYNGSVARTFDLDEDWLNGRYFDLNGNNTLTGANTFTGTTTLNGVVDINNTTSITGQITLDGTITHDSNNGLQPLYITRYGSTSNENLKLFVEDIVANIVYTEDERNGRFKWTLDNTDSSNGGVDANIHTLEFIGNENEGYLALNGSRIITQGNIDTYGNNTDTNNYITGMSGTGDSLVTISRQGLADITWDASHTHSEYATGENFSSTATYSGLRAQATTKGDVGLGSVDNKSSATIRSEITSTNVTDGLGYTPLKRTESGSLDVNAANDTGLYAGSTGSWTNRGPSGNNAGALLNINTHSGSYYSQLWFDTAGDEFYFRSANATLPTSTWQKIYHEGNFAPTLDDVTTNSNTTTNDITVGYTNVNGGVNFLNGATDFRIYNNAGNNELFIRDTTNASMLMTFGVGYATSNVAFFADNGATVTGTMTTDTINASDTITVSNGTDSTAISASGVFMNRANNYIRPTTHNTQNLWFGSSTSGTLDWKNIEFYGTGVFQYNNNHIWHAGNLTPSDYLPLTGGILTGDVTMQSTGPLTFRIEADTDNVTETDTAQFEIVQDGGIVGMRFGMDDSNRSYFQNIYSSVGYDFYLKNSSGGVQQIATQEHVSSNYLPLSGGTLTGDSASTSNALVQINNTYTGDWQPVLEMLGPNAGANDTVYMSLGKAASTYNRGYWGHRHIADGSASNFMTFGYYGNDDILKIGADSNVDVKGDLTASTVWSSVTRTSYVHADGGDGLELYGDDNDGTGRGANIFIGGNAGATVDITIGDGSTDTTGEFTVTNRSTTTPGLVLFDHMDTVTFNMGAGTDRYHLFTDSYYEVSNSDTLKSKTRVGLGDIEMHGGSGGNNKFYLKQLGSMNSLIETNTTLEIDTGGINGTGVKTTLSTVGLLTLPTGGGYAITGKTADDVLLGDGTTTSLAGISGGGGSWNGGTITGDITIQKTLPKIILVDTATSSPSNQSINLRFEGLDGSLPDGEGMALIIETDDSTGTDLTPSVIAEGNFYANSNQKVATQAWVTSQGYGTGGSWNGGTVTGATTFDQGTNTTVTILSNDGGESMLKLIGDSQGTGKVYVGQSDTHGGGIEYNGDGTPASSGSGGDYVTLYRRSGGTDEWTARNFHNSNEWEFRTTPSVGGSLIATQAWVTAQGYGTGGGGSYLPLAGGTMTGTITMGGNNITGSKMTTDYGAGTITVDNVANSTWAYDFTTSTAGNDNNSGFWVNSDGTPDMRLRALDGTVRVLFNSNGSNSYVQTNGGNFGIGTTSPAYKAHVNGSFGVSGLSTFTGNVDSTGSFSVTSNGRFQADNNSSRDKFRVYPDSAYCIGMQDNISFGGFTTDWGMTFQMNNVNGRGFWWGDEGHTTGQGAMALTTNGRLTVADSIRVGYGESDTTIPGATYELDVNGYINATSVTSNAYARDGHNTGHLVGSYNSVAPNAGYTNPIYTIGSSYNPNQASLGSMYGIGFCKDDPSFINGTDLGTASADGWGMYVAANGTAKIFLNGTRGDGHFGGIVYADDFVGNSDRRKKENIVDVEVKDTGARYREFNFKKDESKQLRVGVIAQELEETSPEFVRTDVEGNKSVSYQDLHSAEIAYLKDKVESQSKEIEELKEMVKKLLG